MRREICVLLIVATVPGVALAQDGAYIARLGTDTVSIEVFRFRDGRLEGEVLVRSPRVTLRRYVMQFGSDGNVVHAELVATAPGAPASQPPLLRAAADFTRDSALVTMQRSTGAQTMRIAVPAGAVPMVGDWWAGYEFMVARARRSAVDSTRFRTWQVGAPSLGWTDVVRVGRDSFTIADENQTHRARVDKSGRLLAALRPSQQFRVERVSAPDLVAIAAAWAAREERTGPLVAYSPRDTVRAGIGGAALSVDYSRPGKRGRIIFGGVVPWGEPWRTGANQPTRLVSDRDLEIDGVRVPAGGYSVWTIPSPTGWTLLLNAGGSAAYDPSLDRFRFDMRVAALAQAVEQFTISFGRTGAGGVFNLEWDTVRASIPFTVR